MICPNCEKDIEKVGKLPNCPYCGIVSLESRMAFMDAKFTAYRERRWKEHRENQSTLSNCLVTIFVPFFLVLIVSVLLFLFLRP